MWLELVVLLGVLAGLLLLRVPVAIAMLGAGIITALTVVPGVRVSHLASIGAHEAMAFIFTVVPLFVLMGEVLRRTTVATDIFIAGERILRRVRGGMLHASIAGCAGFAAVSGSSPVTASTIGSMAIPQMLRNGYPPRLASGAVAAGGTLGILIPPSVGLIVFGVITETSVGDLFVAGIIPGLILTGLFMVTTVLVLPLYSKKKEKVHSATHEDESRSLNAETVPEVSDGEENLPSSARAYVSLLSVLALFGVVIGGIYQGVVTPTESAALGALGALVIAYTVGGVRSFRVVSNALKATVLTSGMFLLLLIAGLFVAYIVTIIGVPRELASFTADLEAPRWAIMIVIGLILIGLGMFLDPMSMIVIMAPVLLPTVVALGYDPVWFGIFFLIAVEIGMISPPVGFNLFVLKRVIPQLKFRDIVSGSAIYLPAFAGAMVLLLIFPEVALFMTGR
ncbi:TRAP transporter large permease [Nesterenkonia alkaliphila]|uniref:TRAP transporter large permease subunit n=1 Tax=Nesterenkonia alkaliphila TaxID=1463631 RepID=A0A7K1UFB6_9MICC|nr:TRAP transporter large permease subunit [Nesterenkonia alkaliphila]MVT25165.1 TRAP transporter large permease subunit [Nesterenkonia alkaliphila]GFZ98350.1 C4-dicarboxylate ABC transporter permease [Nesterenkonia alkaliphila]